MGKIRTYANHFCGVGGACWGLHQAGLECRLAIDYLPIAIEYREKNLGHKGVCMDISEYKKDDAHAADLLWTSPPCQTFSSARDGADDPTDVRNHLYMASVYYAKEFKPRFFVLENVVGILSHDSDGKGGGTLARFRKAFSDLGYNVEWNILNARHFGVPQSRPRVFIVGSLTGESGLIPAHPDIPRASFGDVMEHNMEDLAWGSSTYATAMEKIQRTGIGITVVEGKDRKPKRGVRDNGLPRDMLPTLTCGFGGGPTRKKCCVLDKTKSGVPFLRDPSVREGARAQGFPDSWVFPDNFGDGWKLVGNAVASPVSKAIAEHLIAISEGKSPPSKEALTSDEIKSEVIRQQGNEAPPDIGFEE